MLYFYLLLAFVAGAFLPIQIGLNNTLRAGVGNPIIAALISFAVGTICLLGWIFASQAQWPSASSLTRIPAWAWLGGMLGAFYIATSIIVAPRIGAANLISIAITAQLFTSLVLDHYGAIGFAQHSINLWRLLGALLLIAGCLLIVRN